MTRIRHRIPAIALGIANRNPQAYAGITTAILGFMDSLVRDETSSVIARVNATMLIGELESADGKPLTDALKPLLGFVADPALPMAIRVVSLASILKFADAIRQDAALRDSVITASTAIIEEPKSDSDDIARQWLASRAIEMIPAVLDELPAGTATSLTRIVREGSDVDVRIGAALVLGRISTAQSRIDVGAIVDAVEKVAVEMLVADEQVARRYEVQEVLGRSSGDPMGAGYAPMGPGFGTGSSPGGDFFPGFAPGGSVDGGGFGGSSPGGPAGMMQPNFFPNTTPTKRARGIDSPPEQVYRRTAWRLLQLVRALEGADGTKGLAALGSDEETSRAKQLAKVLLNGSDSLDETPDIATLRKLVAIVSPESVDSPAEEPGEDGAMEPSSGANPNKPPQPRTPADSPFDPFK
ncbi:MAG: hypothetical protein ACKOCN_08730 [Planctomycetaceae bacterium]